MCEESSEEILLKTAVEVEGWFENDEYYQKGEEQKGIKDLTIENASRTQLKLSTQLFSVMELKRLELRGCHLHPPTSFHSFPYLSSLDLRRGLDISKHENLKKISLSWYTSANVMMIKSSSIFQLTSLSKLQELDLDFGRCKILYRVDGGDFVENCDNDARGEDPKCWPACCRITRRANGLIEVEGVEDLGEVGNQGNVENQNGNVVNENVQENVRNVLVNGNRVGCSYKEFLACNPKEYDGKGGDVVLTRWIEKIKYVQDMSGCSIDQKVKYTAGSFVGKALTWWNSQIRTLSRKVAVSMSCMSWNDFKFMMIEEFFPSHEMQKLETELWNHAMVEAGHAAYTDRFHELARLVPHLVTP
ncbi:reverse transcriptase domain-containing protein [Tanacetum coccineum]